MEAKVCKFCGKDISALGFKCTFCGSDVCAKHRLPNDHDCLGLTNYKGNQVESVSKTEAPKQINTEEPSKPVTPVPFQQFKPTQFKTNEPLAFSREKIRKPQLRIFYYAILIVVTFIAIYLISQVLK